MSNVAKREIDAKAFRRALGKFATGVTVVTTTEPDGTPRGFTANSFTSVSLDPPLVLICIARSAASCDVFCNASHFSVNILGGNQKDVSNLFASQRSDKFTVAEWNEGTTGTPLIKDALACFECSRNNVVDAGDHIVLIGQVEDFAARDGQPLGFFEGNYFSPDVEHSLVEALTKNSRTIMGVIYQQNGCVLLREDEASGTLTVPEVGRKGGDASLQKLNDMHRHSSLNGSIDFVYSVFEDQRTNSITIYYRGQASGDAPAGYRFFPIGQIPFDQVKDEPVKIMLKRFGEEHAANEFAVYVGDEVTGKYKTVQ